jgi:hypothetical protein
MVALFLQDRRPGDASVENVGIKVRSVRPDHGTQLRIDADLREVGGVAQQLEDSLKAEMGREIDHTLSAVLEPKIQAMIAERSCGDDILQHDLDHIKTLETPGAEATGTGLTPVAPPIKGSILAQICAKKRVSLLKINSLSEKVCADLRGHSIPS